MVPYLTQMLDQQFPSGATIGQPYEVDLTYVNATGMAYTITSALSFGYYPNNISGSSMSVNLTMTFNTLILDLPELKVSSISITPMTVYQGDNVQIVAVVTNIGRTAATNVQVKIWADVNGITPVYLTNSTMISYIGPDGTENISVPIDWNSVPSGTQTITVSVDPNELIDQSSRTYDVLSEQLTVEPNLADVSISSSSISFNPQPAYTGSQVTATIVINNTDGRVNAVNVTLGISTTAGGSNIGSMVITVPENGAYTATFTWIPNQIGTYPVYFTLNANRTLVEYNYGNDAASKNITVEVPINGGDFVVGNSIRPNCTILPSPFPGWYNNITVIGTGTLTLNGYDMNMEESSQYGLQIIVQDHGTLILTNGAILQSSEPIRLYLEGNATLIVTNSVIFGSVTIIADGNTTMVMMSSNVQSDLVAPLTSYTELTAYNCSFSDWSSFGGHARAYLTNIQIASLNPIENAVIYHYCWLQATVTDGTNYTLPGAFVEMENLNGSYYSGGTTNSNGIVTFRVLCNIFTSGAVQQIGQYSINTTYWYKGVSYLGQAIGYISIGKYVPPLQDQVQDMSLYVPSAKPSMAMGITLSDSTPAKNETMTALVTVWNNGSVPAINLVITLYDNGNFVSSSTITSMGMGPSATTTLKFSWTASDPVNEYHNLTLVMESSFVVENAWTKMWVRGIADLSVEQSDISFSNTPLIMNGTMIYVTVHNIGDLAASNVIVWMNITDPQGNIDNLTVPEHYEPCCGPGSDNSILLAASERRPICHLGRGEPDPKH